LAATQAPVTQQPHGPVTPKPVTAGPGINPFPTFKTPYPGNPTLGPVQPMTPKPTYPHMLTFTPRPLHGGSKQQSKGV